MKNERLARFRRAVSLLKKQGLIPKRVDARKATPENKDYKGHTLKSLVKKYDDIVSGKATAKKVSKKELKEFRGKYPTTQGTHIIVPHSATEKITKQGSTITIRSASGIDRVQLNVQAKDIESYLDAIERDHARIDAMKRKNEWFGVRLFGWPATSAIYADTRLLVDELRKYRTVLTTSQSSRKVQRDYIAHLEIVRMPQRMGTKFIGEGERRRTKASKAAKKRAGKRERAKSPTRRAQSLASQRERQRRYRESKKNDPKWKRKNAKLMRKIRRNK